MAGGLEKKGLGRGLSALLADIGPQDAPDPAATAPVPAGDRLIPIDRIRANPNQPRRSFDERELQELAADGSSSLLVSTHDPAVMARFAQRYDLRQRRLLA